MSRILFQGLAKALLLLLSLVVAASAPVAAGTLVVGLPADSNTGNCAPFGCSILNSDYQQVYMNTLFSGLITITGLEFFNTQDNSGAPGVEAGTFTVSLSTTSATWDSLSPNPASNIGADNTEVFSGSLAQPWAFGDTLSIPFSTSFTYAPGPSANLLVDIFVAGAGPPSGLFLDTNGFYQPNNIFGRDINGSGFEGSGYGLVTGFETMATPEPTPFALLGLGLIALEIARLYRNRGKQAYDGVTRAAVSDEKSIVLVPEAFRFRYCFPIPILMDRSCEGNRLKFS
jgi:hypothetical protein